MGVGASDYREKALIIESLKTTDLDSLERPASPGEPFDYWGARNAKRKRNKKRMKHRDQQKQFREDQATWDDPKTTPSQKVMIRARYHPSVLEKHFTFSARRRLAQDTVPSTELGSSLLSPAFLLSALLGAYLLRRFISARRRQPKRPILPLWDDEVTFRH